MSDINHTVYKTTNLTTGRYYVGVHATKNPDDGYLGSGLLLLRDVDKHGRKAFKKEILSSFSDPNLVFQEEVRILKECINDPLCYNLATGGRGLRPGQISPKCIARLYQNSLNLTGKPLSLKHKKWPGEDVIPTGWERGRFPLKTKRKQSVPAWNKGRSTGPEPIETKLKKSLARKSYWSTISKEERILNFAHAREAQALVRSRRRV